MDIKDKVAKLLALSESPNEHEARAALLKARALMAEHKLCPEDMGKDGGGRVVKRTIGVTCTKMTNAWAARLSAVVAEHYCCKAFRNRRHGAKKVEIGLIGLEEDFEICERMFKYAYDCVDSRCRQLKAEWRGKRGPAEIRQIANAYGEGFCMGLRKAFARQEEEHNEWGLALSTPREVLDAMNGMGKPSGYGRVRLDEENMRFVHEGYRDGKRFHPSRRIEGTR